MTDADAWRLIAQRIEERGCIGCGLCAEVYQLWEDGVISWDRQCGLSDQIDEAIEEIGAVRYLIPNEYTDPDPGARAMICELFALECEGKL